LYTNSQTKTSMSTYIPIWQPFRQLHLLVFPLFIHVWPFLQAGSQTATTHKNDTYGACINGLTSRQTHLLAASFRCQSKAKQSAKVFRKAQAVASMPLR